MKTPYANMAVLILSAALVALVSLKIAGVICISWFWALSPLSVLVILVVMAGTCDKIVRNIIE